MMVRGLLIVLMLFSVPLAALAQDDEVCVLPQKDITVGISETQSVVWRVSGGAHIENASASLTNFPATAKNDAEVRLSPDAGDAANILGVIAAGQPVEIIGRSAASDWLYVLAPENGSDAQTGWVSLASVSLFGPATGFRVIPSDQLPRLMPPFQSVNIPPESCVLSEISGGLAQSVGDGYALIVINNVEILLDGTVFIRPTEDSIVVNVLDGRAIVNNTLLIPAGALASLSHNGEATLAPYNTETLSLLPLAAVSGSDFAETELTPARAESEIEAAISETFAPYGVMDGDYDVFDGEVMNGQADAPEAECTGVDLRLTGVTVRDGKIVGMEDVEIIPASATVFSFRYSAQISDGECRLLFHNAIRH